MNRNDTDNSELLAKLVNKYTNNSNFPQLTHFEENIIKTLRKNTKINSKHDKQSIIAFAGKLHIDTWSSHYPQSAQLLKEIYKKDIPYQNQDSYWKDIQGAPEFIITRNANIARISNYLSPISAKLASIAHLKYKNGYNDINEIIKSYVQEHLKYVETNRGHTNLELWHQSELNFLNIDDNMLSKAGNCIYSAVNAASILDLANIPGVKSYVVLTKYIKRGGGHSFVAAYKEDNKEYITSKAIIENGGLHENYNGLYNRHFKRQTTKINGLITKQGWVKFGQNKDNFRKYGIDKTEFFNEETLNDIITSMDKQQIIKLLKDVKRKTNGQCPIMTVYQSDGGKNQKYYNIAEYIEIVKEKK